MLNSNMYLDFELWTPLSNQIGPHSGLMCPISNVCLISSKIEFLRFFGMVIITMSLYFGYGP